LPFHAAKQHSKKQKNDSAEYPARGYKLRAVPLCGTKWLAALFGSFLGKLSIISSFVC